MKKRVFWSLFFFRAIHSFAQVDSLSQSNNTQTDTTTIQFAIPLFSTSGENAESDLEQQDISSLLQFSKDIFVQFASFQFGVSHYRVRGYSAENSQIMINGVNVANLETGFSSWSSWGGLNDVTRYMETNFGTCSNRYGFSGAGGYVNIDSRASSFRKSTRFSYASANRVYRNRIMFTHSTGMKQNGWGLSFSASNRSGNEVYIPGTYFNASAFYISIEKRLNDKNLLGLTAFVAPTEQGRSASATKETFLLAANNYYNNAWGYQNGKVRNSNVSKTQRPMIFLSHTFFLNKNSRLVSTLSYNYGRSSVSGLSYYKTLPPRPDYYRYLPSFYYLKHDTMNGNLLKEKWTSSSDYQQINWDKLIALNQANLFTPPGQASTNSETRARYILENRVENLKNTGLNCTYNSRIRKWFLSTGLISNIYKNRKFKEVEDLLGATFWLDLDQFAENLGMEEFYQLNDIDNPNKKIYRGDRIGYDYSINIRRFEMWGQLERNFRKLDVYYGITFSNSKIWREGFVANGKFPGSSKGRGEKINFLNYGLKAGLIYKISGRHFISVNGSILTRPPETNNLFVAPDVRQDLVSNTGNEQIKSFDLNYLIKYSSLKFRCTYYNTHINNQVWLRTYWHEEYNTLVNLIMKDLNENHQGIEIGLEKNITPSHLIQAAVGIGRFVYTNSPELEAWQYNNSVALFSERKVYLKNYRVGGSPQTVAGIGYKYSGKKLLSAGVYLNYFDAIYVEINPDRRTEEAVEKFQSNESELAARILEQEKLPRYFCLNLNGGKSFRLFKKYPFTISLSINNILNNKNAIAKGFEQMRWDKTEVERFPNKYTYVSGTTYMAMVNFNF